MDAWSVSQERVMPRPRFTEVQLALAVRVLNEKEGK